MVKVRMTDRVTAIVTYETDYDLTDEELEQFNALEHAWEKEEFLLELHERSYETDEDVDIRDSLDVNFEVLG
jgi:hypothetical protein